MWRESKVSRLFSVGTFTHTVTHVHTHSTSLSAALKCNPNKFPLGTGACIEFITTQPTPNLDAHLECQNNGIGLLTLYDFDEMAYLQSYIEVLGEEGADYWLGYYFRNPRSGPELRSGASFKPCSVPVSGGNNFGSQDPLPPAWCPSMCYY